MAARGFTVHSLGAGGRFGRPGKTMAPAARDPNAAPTGGEFVYSADRSMGDFVMTDKEKANYIQGPAPSIASVHKADFIGARTFQDAKKFDKAIDDALKDYMKALRQAYTFQHERYTYCALDLFTEGERQPIVRRYLAVKLAARDLIETRTDQASIEAPGGTLDFFEGGLSDLTKGDNPFEDGTFSLRSASRATCCCVFFSVTLGVLALVVAGAFYAEGSRLYDGEDAGQPVSHFWDGNFWGWPSEKIFRNIWCGLMLGVVFGFLDNFGLFYGTSALDGSFYSIGNKIASGLLAPTDAGQHVTKNNLKVDDKYTTEVAIAAHQITEDMMSGLGNTFRCAASVRHKRSAHALAFPLAPQRSARRRPRHRRARDCQGRARRRALVVAGGFDCHRPRLPAGRLPARRGQVQGQGRRSPGVEVDARRPLHGAHLRFGAGGGHPGRRRHAQGRLPVDHRRLARLFRPHPLVPAGRRHCDAAQLLPHVRHPAAVGRAPSRRRGSQTGAATRQGDQDRPSRRRARGPGRGAHQAPPSAFIVNARGANCNGRVWGFI